MIGRGTIYALIGFQSWLEDNGYSYLADGVGSFPVGDAILEIARRAGVRGLKGSDPIYKTLPMIKDLIRLRCARHDHSPS